MLLLELFANVAMELEVNVPVLGPSPALSSSACLGNYVRNLPIFVLFSPLGLYVSTVMDGDQNIESYSPTCCLLERLISGSNSCPESIENYTVFTSSSSFEQLGC